MEGRSIDQFGNGSSSRDYTYIDDIIEGVLKVLNRDLEFEIFNLGNNHPITLSDFISTIEQVMGKKAKIQKMPKQPGDVEKTWANIVKAKKLLDWQPKTQIKSGLEIYIQWLRKQI